MATLKEAIYDILHTDGQLTTAGTLGLLCEYNAVTKPRIVFYQYPPDDIATPIITYRIGAEAGFLARSIWFDFLAYGGDLKAIHDRIYELLHERNNVVATDWQVKGIIFESSGPEIYDENLKVYFQRARYRIVVCKI